MKISDKKRRIKQGAICRSGKVSKMYKKAIGGGILNYRYVFRGTVWGALTKRIGAALGQTLRELNPHISSIEVKALQPDPVEMRNQGHSWPVQMTIRENTTH